MKLIQRLRRDIYIDAVMLAGMFVAALAVILVLSALAGCGSQLNTIPTKAVLQ